MDDARAIGIIREALPDVVAVYRFGSTIRGEARAESDVDLAVLAAAPLDPVLRFELQEQLAVALRRDVDLVDLRRASTVMAMQVVSTGEPIGVLDPIEKDRFEDYVFGLRATRGARLHRSPHRRRACGVSDRDAEQCAAYDARPCRAHQ